jgi:uncharacterized protein with PQ loop repeat
VSVSIEWLGFAGIALCILGYLPQIIHLIKERCSAGLSAGAYCTWWIAAVLLLSYAFIRRDTVFVVLQAYNVLATSLICFFCIKYKGNLCEDHGGELHA